MPREIPVTRRAAAGLLRRFLLLAALAMLHDTGFAGQLTVSIEVPQARWKSVHLRNMPKDTPVAIEVESSGSIRVAFVHADELRRFPDAPVAPVFQGIVEKKLSFDLSIPRAGDYYLILDNRRGDGARKIRLLIRAEKAKAPDPAPAHPDAGKHGETRT